MRVKAYAAQRFVEQLDTGGRGDGRRSPYDVEELPCVDAEAIRDLSRLLTAITEGDSDERLIAALNEIVGDREEFEKAVIVWADLIEELVEAAEGRYPEKGRGPLKKAEVKEVVRYLLRAGRFQIPQLPDYLQPVVVDVVADFTVDTLVDLGNRYRLWAVTPAAGTTPADVWHRIKHAVLLVLRPLTAPIGWLASRIYLALRQPVELSPAFRAALARVERDGLIARGKTPLERSFELIIWIGHNRDALIAGVQLVALATKEVEEFAELDSHEKKACARSLVFAVLEEAGWEPSSELLRAKLSLGVDLAIEVVVALFNKHSEFRHFKPRRERAGPATALVAARPSAASAPPRPAPRGGRRPR